MEIITMNERWRQIIVAIVPKTRFSANSPAIADGDAAAEKILRFYRRKRLRLADDVVYSDMQIEVGTIIVVGNIHGAVLKIVGSLICFQQNGECPQWCDKSQVEMIIPF